MTTTAISTVRDLDGFVRTAKSRAVPDDALVALLRQNGWSERRIYGSLSAYYGELLGVAPPSRSGRGEQAREAFLYLLNFITLGFWTVALGRIFIELIARRFPDAAHPVYGHSVVYDVSWQLATLIVAFPCFLVIGRLIAGELRRRPDAFDSGIRAWLTHVALVIAGLIMLSDGIFFVSAFLQGELTTQFILNTIVVIGLGGGVFAYYLRTLRPANAE
jgi:cytochrome c-type biogenesis protein CcmH/NrfF